jgi:hypothetical protein
MVVTVSDFLIGGFFSRLITHSKNPMKIQFMWSGRLYRNAIFYSRRQAHGQNCADRGLYLVFGMVFDGSAACERGELGRCLARGGKSKAAAKITSEVRFGVKRFRRCCPAGRPPVAEARCRGSGIESLSGRSAPRPLLSGRGESQAFEPVSASSTGGGCTGSGSRTNSLTQGG